MGVLLGSPLSPILVLVFIDDLLCYLAAQASVQAFTNDILIWWTLGKGETSNALGNVILDMVLVWAHH